MEYTPQPINETTFELEEYTPASIEETTFEIGDTGAKVTLLSPENNATGVSKEPTFSWEAFEPEANRRYQVRVTQVSGNYTSALQYVTPDTSFTIPQSDQLTGSTTYYWKVRPAVVKVQDSYIEDFNVADQQGWGANWTTQILTGGGGHEILNGKAVSSIQAGDPLGRVGARLNNVVFDDFDIYLRNQSFVGLADGAEPTWHVRTQDDWRPDHFITGYFYYLTASGQIRIGAMPSGGGVSFFDGGGATFTIDETKLYDIRKRGDGNRLRFYIWESGTDESTEPTLDAVDPESRYSNGGYATKIAGNANGSMSKESIEISFGSVDEVDEGVTVTSFQIDQSDKNLNANTSGQLSTTTQGTNVSGGATFVSSNTNVLTVNNDGVYTWVGEGTATITATSTEDNSFTDTVTITALSDTGFIEQDSKEGDEVALQALYSATTTQSESWSDRQLVDGTGANRGFGNETGWSATGMDLDQSIYGVITHQVNGETRVLELNLNGDEGPDTNRVYGNGLVGETPIQLRNLKKMKAIRLRGNGLFGSVEHWIQGITDCEIISLQDDPLADEEKSDPNRTIFVRKTNNSFNKFDGNIPDLDMLTSLFRFVLSNSDVTGWPSKFPPSLKHWLCKDNKVEAPFPRFEGCDMVHVIIKNRRDPVGKLQGDYPIADWNTWTNLVSIYADFNEATGTLPDFPLCDNTIRIYEFSGSINTSGPLPWGVMNRNPTMTYFKINSSTPQTWPETMDPNAGQSLTIFNIQGGGLQGAPPDWIFQLGGLVQLLWQVDFQGEHLPDNFFELSNIRNLILNGCNIGGPMPEGTLSNNCRAIFLNSNNLIGGFPASWAVGLVQLRGNGLYYFNNNNLEGLVPEYWAEVGTQGTGRCEHLRIHNNKFTPKDILPHRSAIQSRMSSPSNYIYLPQKPFGQSQSLGSGSTIDLSDFGYTGQSQQWLRNGSPISGETGLTIDTSLYGDGEYVLELTHPDINYTFQSEIQQIG